MRNQVTSTRADRRRAKTYAVIPEVLPLPNLIEIQKRSYDEFLEDGLRTLIDEISPIESFNDNLVLRFGEYRFEDPKYSEDECRIMDLTYAAPWWIEAELINKETGEIQKQEVFMGEFPLMTHKGTFIFNGAERVVVSQLIRSPNTYYSIEEDRSSGRVFTSAKVIPDRGAWLEFDTSKRDRVTIKVDRKRKIPFTIFVRALGAVDVDDECAKKLRAAGYEPRLIKEGTDEEIYELFGEYDDDPDHSYLEATLSRDPTKNAEEALIEFYKKLRPGDPATRENAVSYIESLIFDPKRYDLAKVGRYKMNQTLDLNLPLDVRTLTQHDIVRIIQRLIDINNERDTPDEIDHLGNRRVKTVGELLYNQLRIGFVRMERVIRERMSIRDPEQMTPISLANIRPVVAAVREFFGGSQLSQFMEQTNPLAELTHKRTLSALGPGGLKRERAGFDVRDVHHSHYGRICPIETPEGPNIGLIGRLATYGRVNDLGFIETPYRKVIKRVPNDGESVVGLIVRETLIDPETEEPIIEEGERPTKEQAERLATVLDRREIKIRPRVSEEVEYLSADAEEKFTIAQANSRLDAEGYFINDRASVRHGADFRRDAIYQVDYMDVSPKQVVGVSASLIPFLEHDDANRALMGSNMQRQAVPLVKPEAPLVATGIEGPAARDSGQVAVARRAGQVINVASDRIVVREEDGNLETYHLRRFSRSNQSTTIDQRPIVVKGQRVEAGDVLADSSSTEDGELALGQNVLTAFLSWEGGNFEDAILISEDLVRRDKYTSIHIEKHEVEARDTKLGPEEITRDIPNVGEDALKDLDERGIIRIGAEVGPGDILVGKITPKGETELTPEEKLLRAIFGEKAREVKDSSLRLPHGERGKVVEVREFTRENHQDLPVGVEQMVRVSIAQTRKITEGDKMAGRHGNKGVISKVVPVEDMPYLEDGTPVELILNPLGVPGRMNIGQILETHLGWAADRLGFRAITPVFDGASEAEIAAELCRAWMIDRAWLELTERAIEWLKEQEYDLELLSDDNDARALYLYQYFTEGVPEASEAGSLTRAEARGVRLQDVLRDRTLMRRIWLEAWLEEKGYQADEILSWESDQRSVEERQGVDERAVQTCLRLWIEHRGHADRLEDVAPDDDVLPLAREVSEETGWPLPLTGKQRLYDGKTGEPYDAPVTVGVINMLKLAHLVEDKVHARSTGPYSLVTQQPLGGKAQFGGQRFGEMEVWALEAYGAAHTLQEMLTVKSDDVAGRTRTYEAIVKGEPIGEAGIPESFRVLVKELQSLALSVEVIGEGDARIQMGKEIEEESLPKLGFGLGLPKFKKSDSS